eukprot:gnl/TRDRNA2_/TRDRNA2_138980_c0_seq1.p1 gnl/TRDRNA2_/TRDRNA2_138980_c0~~gnl/TRDRNA2_/TRDRNA2_138980_c0_seq1.p1  ORF type:complete len:335 (-),score=41.65 gnl/TRDRNA2_/TRDRNA2_138980_c0_seq1:465-1469(-)
MLSVTEAFLFPAPAPMYAPDDFQEKLIWIPRRAGEPRCEGVPCLLLEAISFSPGTRLALYFHANHEDLGSTRHQAERLRNALGSHVLAVEYSGYGCSAGVPSEESLKCDVDSVMRFVRHELQVPLDRVLVLGSSLGAAVAIYAAAKHPVGGLATFAAFSSVREIVGAHLGLAWLVPDIFRSVDRMQQVRCPTLLAHGTEDTVVPQTHASKLADACSADKIGVNLIDGIGHNDMDVYRHLGAPLLSILPHEDEGEMPRLNICIKPEWGGVSELSQSAKARIAAATNFSSNAERLLETWFTLADNVGCNCGSFEKRKHSGEPSSRMKIFDPFEGPH